MILSSIPTLLKNNLSHLYNVFIKQSITAIENLRFEIYFRFSRIQTYRVFYFLRRFFVKHQTLSFVGFSVAGQDRAKLGDYQFQSFLLIVVIVISILLKPTF